MIEFDENGSPILDPYNAGRRRRWREDSLVRNAGRWRTPVEHFEKIKASPAWRGAEVFYPGPNKIGLRLRTLFVNAEVIVRLAP